MKVDRAMIYDVAREVASRLAGRTIREDQLLISSGLIDSLSILRMIAELETRLKVSIPTDTLQPEDFDDLDRIVETVERVAKPAE